MSTSTLAERLHQWSVIAGFMAPEGSAVAEDMAQAAAALEKCRAVLEPAEINRLKCRGIAGLCDYCHQRDHTPDCAWAEALEATR